MPVLPLFLFLLIPAWPCVSDLEQARDAGAKLFDRRQATAFAALAKISYCGPGPVPMFPYGNPLILPKLIGEACGDFCKRAGFEVDDIALVATKGNGQLNANFAYVAKVSPLKKRDEAPADCIVSFRGTWVVPANVQTDLNSSFVDFKTPSCKEGCKVTGGAYLMFQQLKSGLIAGLEKVGCPKGSSVAFTGHSLGGQVASIAMFVFQDELDYEVALSYTFEQSPPFNKKAVEVFEDWLFDRPVSYFRITHTNDAVPRSPDNAALFQPGFQVWFYGVNSPRLLVFCGSQLDAPKCGVNKFPYYQLCQLTNDSEACGPAAPFGGPHCNFPLAPAGSFCSMAGNTKSAFSTVTVQTCLLGSPMPKDPTLPTLEPQVFPSVEENPEPPPGSSTPAPLDLHQQPSQNYLDLKKQYANRSETLPSRLDCFRNNTAASPPGMVSRYTTHEADVYACQKRCKDMAYCELFTYRPATGACEVTGGWGQYVEHIYGSVAGPKDCALEPPDLNVSEKAALNQEFLRFVMSQFDYESAFRRDYEVYQSAPALSSTVRPLVGFGAAAMLAVAGIVLLVVKRVGIHRCGRSRDLGCDTLGQEEPNLESPMFIAE